MTIEDFGTEIPKARMQNIIIPENTTLVPESVCVAVVRDSRDMCWAEGKWETSSSGFLLGKLRGAVPKQCCEVRGQAVPEGYQSRGEEAPCALCV